MKINVTKPFLPPFEEYCEEIKEIWDSCWLTNNGPLHKRFEEQLKNYLDVKNLTLFVNGHLALESALSLYNFPKGSEVITTPFTFVSTSNAISRNNLVPVFCDINLENYTIDTNKIESLITNKTVAIVAVHVYGSVCDVEKIQKIAEKHNLIVIYDAAHAFGVKYKNISVGNFGDVSMFSFHATKVFNSVEGGCLTYNDSSKYSEFNKLKNFGLNGEEECDYIGANCKMNEFQAAMGLCNLRHVDECIAFRKSIVEQYRKRLANVPGIILLKDQPHALSNYSYFPVLFDGYKYSRDEIKTKLERNNIGTRKYFYPLVSDFKCYKKVKCGSIKNAIYVSSHVLTLPLYSDLRLEDVDKICDIILENKE